MAGDEPYTWRDRFEEKLEAQADVLRDVQGELRHHHATEAREHAEIHERLRAVEGHTHDMLSPPKNGAKRREWGLALGLLIGGIVAAILRELGGVGVP